MYILRIVLFEMEVKDMFCLFGLLGLLEGDDDEMIRWD